MSRKSTDFVAVSGDGYELQMGRFSRVLAPRFLDFVELVDGGRILEVGCGTGALTEEIVRRTSTTNIIAIDISRAYVEHAKRSTSNPRASFDVADVASLPYPDFHFDHVLSQLVLDFVPDTDRAFQEIRRVLCPGGRLSAAVWDARGGLVFNRLFLDTAAMLDRKANELRSRNFTRPLRRPGHLERIAISAGFNTLSRSEIMIRTEFMSFDDYWAPFDGRDGPIPAYLRQTSPEMRAKIKDAVRRAYLDGEEDGPRSYIAVAFAISALRDV